MSRFEDDFIVILECGEGSSGFDDCPYAVMSLPLINFIKSFTGLDVVRMGKNSSYELFDLDTDKDDFEDVDYIGIRNLIRVVEEVMGLPIEVRVCDDDSCWSNRLELHREELFDQVYKWSSVVEDWRTA